MLSSQACSCDFGEGSGSCTSRHDCEGCSDRWEIVAGSLEIQGACHAGRPSYRQLAIGTASCDANGEAGGAKRGIGAGDVEGAAADVDGAAVGDRDDDGRGVAAGA